jgi:uncharacterized membrane protein YqjE
MTAINPDDRATLDVRDSTVDDQRSVGELFGQLTTDMSTLVRKEIELARIEIKEEVAKAGKAGGMLGGTAVAAYMALLLISFAAAWGLSEIIPEGFAFLVVGLVYAVIAAVLYAKGRDELSKVNPTPTQTIETLKEDAQWASQLKQ